MENKKKSVTIKDIAQMAGVSPAAVSYVINGKGGVGPVQRARIQELLAQSGYRQDLRAKGLKTRRSFNIHAVLRREAAPACKDFYFGVVARIVDFASEGGYSVVPAYQSDDPCDDTLVDIIAGGRTDGVIAFQGLMQNAAKALANRNIPLLIVNPGFQEAESRACVIIDFEDLTYRATAFLASLGHRHIGFIGMEALPFFYDMTIRGFERALRAYGLRARKEWVRGEAVCADSAGDAMRKMLACNDIPTAVFCAQDNFAFSAISAARKMGYSVPGDISFIGLDDVPEAKYFCPPLTTIAISPEALARRAVDMLFSMMGGNGAARIVLPCGPVIVRETAIKPGVANGFISVADAR
ncbi:MAG: LacI family transcriptional regulator [Clostridiales bacterium]|jgi:DNA-binding LacI/PurR family transcriptional regulator|nr:LacI family transcriptional regulator [Clostridiales bacterium]